MRRVITYIYAALALAALLPLPLADARIVRKDCVKHPRSEPIGGGCRQNPCDGNCRWFIQPNGDCVRGSGKCTETDGEYLVDTYVAPCGWTIGNPCGCQLDFTHVGPQMRYWLDDCGE